MDGWRLVSSAQVLPLVPSLSVWQSEKVIVNSVIPESQFQLEVQMNVSTDKLPVSLLTLEHVQIMVDLFHEKLGDLEITLACPSGIKSVVGQRREEDRSKQLEQWTFSTVKCWGEEPSGLWKLSVSDHGGSTQARGYLNSWRITLYGSTLTREDYRYRQWLVTRATAQSCLQSHNQKNNSCMTDMKPLKCPSQPQMNQSQTFSLPDQTLKVCLVIPIICSQNFTSHILDSGYCQHWIYSHC
jgi:proprotein convertase subtilisin/kexin type 7